MEVVPEEAISMIKKAKRNYGVSHDIAIISKLNIRRLFLPQAVHTALGKNKGTLMMLLHVLHSLTSIREVLKGLRLPVSCSTRRPVSSHPPTARNICCRFCRSQRQILEESWVFTTWCKWEFSFSWFVNTAATHKPILFTLRWSLTLPFPTNIYNLFGTWCFKNKNSFVIMVLLCI